DGERPLAAQVVNGQVVKNLQEPGEEAALLIERGQVLECAREGFLSEIFRERTILEHACGKVHGGSSIAADEGMTCRLGARKRLLHQIGITGFHCDSLY